MLNITCIIFLRVPILQFVVDFVLLFLNVTSAKSFKLHVTGCWIFIRLNQKVFLCVYGTSYKKHPCFGVFGFGSANRLVLLLLIFCRLALLAWLSIHVASRYLRSGPRSLSISFWNMERWESNCENIATLWKRSPSPSDKKSVYWFIGYRPITRYWRRMFSFSIIKF